MKILPLPRREGPLAAPATTTTTAPADPTAVPPWHRDADDDVRAAYEHAARQSSAPAAFQRVLTRLNGEGIAWFDLGAALIELGPRRSCPSANDIRVFAQNVRKHAVPAGSSSWATVRSATDPIEDLRSLDVGCAR